MKLEGIFFIELNLKFREESLQFLQIQATYTCLFQISLL